MAQLADLFSVPEMSLLCNATEFFVNNHIDYHPDILFRDVKVRMQNSLFCEPYFKFFFYNRVQCKASIRLCIKLCKINQRIILRKILSWNYFLID